MNFQKLILSFIKRKLLIISLIIIFAALFFQTSFSQNIGDYRTNASGKWDSTAIWHVYNGTTWINTAIAPSSSSPAINIQAGHTVTLNFNLSVDQLTVNGILSISAGDSVSIVNGLGTDLTLSGGITGAGNLFLASGSEMNCLNGSITGAGQLNIFSGAAMNLTSGIVTIDRTINNNGILSWSGNAINGTGMLNNKNIFNIQTTFGANLNMGVNNYGTLNKTTNNFNVIFGSSQNMGTVNILSGGLAFGQSSGSAAINGVINVSAGGIIQFGQNSSTTFTINSTISGAGNTQAYSTAVNYSASCVYNITGNTTALSGTATFTPGMTLTNIGNITPAGGTINLPSGLIVGGYGTRVQFSLSGSLILNTGLTFNFQDVVMNGGTLSGGDSITVSDSLTVSTAFILGTAAITLKPGSLMTVANNNPTIDKALINNGIINLISGSMQGAGTLYNNTIFNITGTGLSCFMPMVNAGTINKNSNNAGQYSASFTNLSTGILNITAGSYMTIAGGGTWSVAGTINIAAGTTFQLGNSASATYNVTAALSGAGNFAGHSANVNFLPGCAYNIGGNTTVYSGATTFNSGMTIINIGTIGASSGILNLQPGLVIPAMGSTLVISGGGVVNFNSGQKHEFTSITEGGNIGGSDTVNLSGNMTITSGTLSGTGPLNILSGAVMNINFSGITINKTINNSGTVNWTIGTVSGNGVLNNNNIFNAAPTTGFSFNPLINNYGTMNKTTSPTVPILACNNSGTVNINSGVLQITPNAGTFTHSGIFNVPSGTSLVLGQVAGSVVHNINGLILGAGAVSLGATTNNFGASAVYNISGSTTLTFGITNFNSATTLTNLGNLSVGNGVMNFPSGLIIGGMGSNLVCSNAGTINFNTGKSYTFNQIDLGGTFGGSDSIFISTTLNWTNGGNSGSSVIVLKNGGTAIVNNTAVNIGGKFINNGTLTWVQAGIGGSGMFINNNILNVSTSSPFTFFAALVNNGTINKTTSPVTPFTGNLTNNGNINVNAAGISVVNGSSSGTITLTPNTTFTVNNGVFTSTGVLIIPPTASITGNGTMTFNQPSVVNDGTISVSNIQFGAVTNLSGSGTMNTQSATFLNGSNVTLLSNQQFRFVTVNSGAVFNLNGFKASFSGANTPLTGLGTVNLEGTFELNGTSSQNVPNGLQYKNLTLNNSAGVSLVGALNVNDTLNIAAGFLNIVAHNITISSVGYLKENPGCTVRGTTGTVSTTRTINAPNGENIAGLGASITSTANLGTTTISRGHWSYTINGGQSVMKYFNISPANNSNLNAALTYHYDNYELNGINENLLSLYRSTNAGVNWSVIGGARDAANNNITYSGINAFSYWTAAVNPLAASINVTAIVDALYNASSGTLNKKDTMIVYLRNSSAPYAILDSAKILLDTVTFSGTAYFNTTPSGTYYISLKYRNALETWSKAGGENYTTGSSMSFDFTSAQSQSYGNSTILKSGKYCIASGDLNQDGFVNGNDFTPFSQEYGLTGYLKGDLNGDGVVNGNDFTSFSAGYGRQSLHP